MTAGLESVDDTTDLDGAGLGGLLKHELARDVHAFKGDEGPAGTFGGRPGSNASDRNNYKQINYSSIIFKLQLFF
jgi:hypothetical protein